MERGRAERRWVDALHFQQLSRFGGLRGTRDEGALESALGRPRHQWLYGKERELARLAAAYAFGLARNHPCGDGNKRIAFVAMAVLLELNGLELVADETVATIRALAAGEVSEDELTEWVRGHVQPLGEEPSGPTP